VRRRLARAARGVVAAALALTLAIRWSAVPRALANSWIGAPVVSVLNHVRARAYFARDERCLRALAANGVPFTFVAAPRHADDCPFRNVVRMRPGGTLRRPLYMTCRLATAFVRFERDVLQPAAERHFSQPVAVLIENGVRNCRPVAGYAALLSEHAFANAIDVAGVVLRDGTAIRLADAESTDPAHAAFFHDVTTRACEVFRTVLGPGFDDRHRDHLHLDMGMLGGCRP
jgi:hypothetical protein